MFTLDEMCVLLLVSILELIKVGMCFDSWVCVFLLQRRIYTLPITIEKQQNEWMLLGIKYNADKSTITHPKFDLTEV